MVTSNKLTPADVVAQALDLPGAPGTYDFDIGSDGTVKGLKGWPSTEMPGGEQCTAVVDVPFGKTATPNESHYYPETYGHEFDICHFDPKRPDCKRAECSLPPIAVDPEKYQRVLGALNEADYHLPSSPDRPQTFSEKREVRGLSGSIRAADKETVSAGDFIKVQLKDGETLSGVVTRAFTTTLGCFGGFTDATITNFFANGMDYSLIHYPDSNVTHLVDRAYYGGGGYWSAGEVEKMEVLATRSK